MNFNFPFLDKLLKIVPDKPLLQTRYIYYLSLMVFCGLIFYAGSIWYSVFTAFRFQILFQGIFMLAIALLSLFGVKQTRNAYLMVKQLSGTTNEIKETAIQKVESVEEMMDGFEKKEK